MFSHIPWQWRVRPCVTHRLALFHQINGFVDEGGEVGGPAQPDFGRHFVVHPQHVLETPTRALHVQHAAAQCTAPEPYTRGKWEGGGERKGGAHTKTDGQSEPTVLFHSSPPWKGTNYDNCSLSVSDSIKLLPTRGETKKKKEGWLDVHQWRDRENMITTTSDTDSINRAASHPWRHRGTW